MKTAFKTKNGHFEVLVVPMEPKKKKNVPATFQALLNFILLDFRWLRCLTC